MFPLGFAGLAFGLFLIDSAIKKRPVWESLKAIITNPTGFRSSQAALNNTTFTEPAAITSADIGTSVGVGGSYGPVVAYALAQVGKPYVWGTSGPNTFDCSGLTEAAYKQVGITLPHYSNAQALEGTAVNASNMAAWEPGDLMFPHAGHVAMYVGGGKVVEAMNPRDGIRVNPAASHYWRVRRISTTAGAGVQQGRLSNG